jgi:hypothetical protein
MTQINATEGLTYLDEDKRAKRVTHAHAHLLSISWSSLCRAP